MEEIRAIIKRVEATATHLDAAAAVLAMEQDGGFLAQLKQQLQHVTSEHKNSELQRVQLLLNTMLPDEGTASVKATPSRSPSPLPKRVMLRCAFCPKRFSKATLLQQHHAYKHTPRPAMSDNVRTLVLHKYERCCALCRVVAPLNWHVEYIVPKHLNGADTLDNYQLVCDDCSTDPSLTVHIQRFDPNACVMVCCLTCNVVFDKRYFCNCRNYQKKESPSSEYEPRKVTSKYFA